MDWTTEQILGLAPDQFTLRASRGVADPHRWVALHHDTAILWGVYPNGSKKTGETAVFLPSLSLTCTCSSRKSPCRHSLSLLLLWQQQAKQFTPQPPPPQLAAWMKRQNIGHMRTAETCVRSQPTQTVSQRLPNLKIGLRALELWLTDMVRHGLASLPDRPKTYWETMAHQLVDAQAIALADELQSIAKLPAAQPNWPEAVFKRLGRLYLIIQGFHNYDQLPATTQADLQTAVGWLPQTDQEAALVTDSWLVLGRQQEPSGKQLKQITWLWGQESQRFALLIDMNQSTRPDGFFLATSSVWYGTLQFVPSNWPLIASRCGGLNQQPDTITPHGYDTIRHATRAYSAALAANPWLIQFPILLHNPIVSQSPSGWQLGDKAGTTLPLPDKFVHGWHLLALSGSDPSLTLFGVWNGRFLKPLSVKINSQWQDCHIWRGIR